MTDRERVTRLRDIKNVDAWVTQFTIELEEKRPELAEMLTKVGWDKLPKPEKAEAEYTNEEKEAVTNNRDAHNFTTLDCFPAGVECKTLLKILQTGLLRC